LKIKELIDYDPFCGIPSEVGRGNLTGQANPRPPKQQRRRLVWWRFSRCENQRRVQRRNDFFSDKTLWRKLFRPCTGRVRRSATNATSKW